MWVFNNLTTQCLFLQNNCKLFVVVNVVASLQLTAFFPPSLITSAKLTSPTAGLQNSMSAVGVGQPSAPTINSSTPIDPSSMQRAYAALGLPYSSQATAQGQSQQTNPGQGQPAGPQNPQAQQQQQQLQQQMRPINTLGKPEH